MEEWFRLLIVCGLAVVTLASEGMGDVAICMSGHVRSMVEPKVYMSLKQNLIDSIGRNSKKKEEEEKNNQHSDNGGLNVDLFLYLELDENQRNGEDVMRINAGWDKGPNDMTISSEDLKEALRVLDPFKLQFHDSSLPSSNALNDEDATVASALKLNNNHTCQFPSKQAGPQLLKMHKCFQLVMEHEKTRGFKYEWVIRSRPDLGWIFPMPSISSFSNKHIYVTSKYWPMGDQVFNYYTYYSHTHLYA
jgi:hypothetical protein